jgi:hypothetical protein
MGCSGGALAGALGIAVGDHDTAGAKGGEVLQGQVAHLAGADDEDDLVTEAIEDRLRDLDGDARDRQFSAAQAGGFADLFGDAQGALKEGVEGWANAPCVDGGLVCVAHLTEDLAFAEHEAFDAGGDAEQVSHRGVGAERDEVAGDERGIDRLEPREPFGEFLRGRQRGAGGAGGVEFDAIASGY